MRGFSSSSGVALFVALTLLISGCSWFARSEPPPANTVVEVVVTPPQAPPAPSPQAPPAAPADALDASFAELVATLPAGAVGITIVGGQQSRSFGNYSTGAAWSTIKVALAIAALRKDAEAAKPLVARAITASDNAAAEQLWTMLGTPATAAQAVATVLAQGGDTTTTVQSERIRPPFTAFGQTIWPQQQQARFAFGLPCVETSAPVLDFMKNLDGGQLWGLATRDGVAAKGGWGPEPDGGYLVRQIALVTTPSGTFGAALAAKPADGSFDTGTAILNKLGKWVNDHTDQLPVGNCATG